MKKIKILGKKIERNYLILIALSLLGIIVFIYNYFFLNSEYMNIVSIILVLVGPVVWEYRKYSDLVGIEQRFPDFLNDLSEGIRAGMTLPQVIKSLKDTDYGPLTPQVRKMAIQVDWGISFEKMMNNMMKTGTPVLRRTISTILEAYKGGGKLADIIESVSKSVNEINKIRKERESALYSQMLTGYIIYFVFVGILIVLMRFLLPSLVMTAGTITPEQISSLYREVFQWLVIVQGFFSGLAVGKMTEGHIIAGLKHSLIMLLIGYSALVFFI